MTTILSSVTLIRDRLRAATWPSGGEVVAASSAIFISAAPEPRALENMRLPAIMIRPAEAQVDPVADEEPNLIHQTIVIRILAKVAGDATGQNALIGGHQPSASSSRGRGVLEIEREVMRSINFLNVNESIQVQSRGKSLVGAVLIDGLGYVAYRDLSFEVIGTDF